MRNEIWSAEQTQETKKLWADGMSAGEIAKITGRTRNAILGRLHRLKNASTNSNAFWTPQMVEELKQYRSQGLTSHQIGELLGKTPKAVVAACSRYNVGPRMPKYLLKSNQA